MVYIHIAKWCTVHTASNCLLQFTFKLCMLHSTYDCFRKRLLCAVTCRCACCMFCLWLHSFSLFYYWWYGFEIQNYVWCLGWPNCSVSSQNRVSQCELDCCVHQGRFHLPVIMNVAIFEFLKSREFLDRLTVTLQERASGILAAGWLVIWLISYPCFGCVR